MELTRRLKKNEGMPDELVAKLTATSLVSIPGLGLVMLKGVYKQVPSAEADNAKVAVKRPNSLWTILPVRASLRQMKEFVLATIKKHLPADWCGDLPAFARKSAPMNSAAKLLVNDYLYDEEFHQRMDETPETLRFLVFKDGKTYDRVLDVVLERAPNQFIITKQCGVHWPAERMIDVMQSDLKECLEAVKAFHPVWGPVLDVGHDIPDTLKQRFADVAKRIQLLDVVFKMFDDWIMTVWVLTNLAKTILGRNELDV